MPHAINSYVLTGTKSCFDKAIHVHGAVINLLCGFCCKHSGAVTKSDVSGSILYGSKCQKSYVRMTLTFALDAAFSKCIHSGVCVVGGGGTTENINIRALSIVLAIHNVYMQ